MLERRNRSDMQSVKGRGSASKSASDGSRPSRCCGKSGTVESSRWGGSSPSRRLPTIWFAYGTWRGNRPKLSPQSVRGARKRFQLRSSGVTPARNRTASESRRLFFRSLLDSYCAGQAQSHLLRKLLQLDQVSKQSYQVA